MAHCATEFFERDVFASNGLDNIWARNKHVACFAHHEYEVGHCRRVHSATRAWSENHRDLWDNTTCLHVAMEDAAVARERHNTFLDSRAGSVIETN